MFGVWAARPAGVGLEIDDGVVPNQVADPLQNDLGQSPHLF
jgi:hypothetical protein